jgi:hypothetical protein
MLLANAGKNMIRAIRRFIAVGFIACVFAATLGICGDNSVSAAQIHSAPRAQVAGRLIEVRLRRLHLVRPDLIPYPIAYELIC